jgi:hypothetical protein
MSFATTLGHTFTGVIGHHGRVHLPHHHVADPPSAPAPERPRHACSAPAEPGSSPDRRDLEQWRAAFTMAAGFNR